MNSTVGIVELKNIAYGINASDDILKLSGAKLISAQSLCPGKYEIIMSGELSQVESAMNHIKNKYSHSLVDYAVFGKIEKEVIQALLGCQIDVIYSGSIGVIETYSASSAIMAADIAMKSSNVSIIELRIARGMGGKGFVLLNGNISDVQAAINNGSKYAKEQGLLAACSIIGSPHADLWKHI